MMVLLFFANKLNERGVFENTVVDIWLIGSTVNMIYLRRSF